jgi:leucine dehydrogenase
MVLNLHSLDCAGYRQVIVFRDRTRGLHAVIAVHSTALGPAVGGCRLWGYASEHLAIVDALRLAKGMSYKNALASRHLGAPGGIR